MLCGLANAAVVINPPEPRFRLHSDDWKKPWSTAEEEITVRCGDYFCSVPEGFRTDFASIPTSVLWLFGRYGPVMFAALVHDFLLESGSVDREVADAIFYKLCVELGIPKWQCETMYAAVRSYTKWRKWFPKKGD